MVKLGLVIARKRLVWGEMTSQPKMGLMTRIGLGALERTLGLPCAVALPLGARLIVLGRLAEIPFSEGGLVVLPLLEIERGVVYRVARETELRIPYMYPWSVSATAGRPSSTARLTMLLTRVAPSSMEYSEWL